MFHLVFLSLYIMQPIKPEKIDSFIQSDALEDSTPYKIYTYINKKTLFPKVGPVFMRRVYSVTNATTVPVIYVTPVHDTTSNESHVSQMPNNGSHVSEMPNNTLSWASTSTVVTNASTSSVVTNTTSTVVTNHTTPSTITEYPLKLSSKAPEIPILPAMAPNVNQHHVQTLEELLRAGMAVFPQITNVYQPHGPALEGILRTQPPAQYPSMASPLLQYNPVYTISPFQYGPNLPVNILRAGRPEQSQDHQEARVGIPVFTPMAANIQQYHGKTLEEILRTQPPAQYPTMAPPLLQYNPVYTISPFQHAPGLPVDILRAGRPEQSPGKTLEEILRTRPPAQYPAVTYTVSPFQYNPALPDLPKDILRAGKPEQSFNHHEEATEPFSLFLKSLLQALALKNLKDLRKLIKPFEIYVTTLVDSGKLIKLGATISSFIAQEITDLRKPIAEIQRQFFIGQISLENRRKMLTEGVNAMLDEMDDVYDASEEEAMQRVLHEVKTFPNASKNGEQIVKGFVDDVFLHPMHRIAGTNRGALIFARISTIAKANNVPYDDARRFQENEYVGSKLKEASAVGVDSDSEDGQWKTKKGGKMDSSLVRDLIRSGWYDKNDIKGRNLIIPISLNQNRLEYVRRNRNNISDEKNNSSNVDNEVVYSHNDDDEIEIQVKIRNGKANGINRKYNSKNENVFDDNSNSRKHVSKDFVSSKKKDEVESDPLNYSAKELVSSKQKDNELDPESNLVNNRKKHLVSQKKKDSEVKNYSVNYMRRAIPRKFKKYQLNAKSKKRLGSFGNSKDRRDSFKGQNKYGIRGINKEPADDDYVLFVHGDTKSKVDESPKTMAKDSDYESFVYGDTKSKLDESPKANTDTENDYGNIISKLDEFPKTKANTNTDFVYDDTKSKVVDIPKTKSKKDNKNVKYNTDFDYGDIKSKVDESPKANIDIDFDYGETKGKVDDTPKNKSKKDNTNVKYNTEYDYGKTRSKAVATPKTKSKIVSHKSKPNIDTDFDYGDTKTKLDDTLKTKSKKDNANAKYKDSTRKHEKMRIEYDCKPLPIINDKNGRDRNMSDVEYSQLLIFCDQASITNKKM